MGIDKEERRRVEGKPGGRRSALSAGAGFGAMPLGSLCRRPPLIVAPDRTLREALAILRQVGAEAGLVAQVPEIPLGIVTLGNLLDALAVQGGSLDDPVIFFMTAAPRSLPAEAPIHRARVLMTRCRLKHLLLTEDDGRVCNLISQADIPGYREGGAGELSDEINAARDLEALAAAAAETRRRGGALFEAGLGVETLCQWLSGMNDLIGMRAIELTADRFELPPASWAWLVFGSEGRLEQTFATDQDNGLIFQPDREEETEPLRQAFLPFAREVNEALDRCGFVLCPGRIMAGNPDCCLSVREWRDKFDRWLRTPEPEAILNATIFFDFRPLYGQDDLVDDLRSWLLPQPAAHPRFLHLLATQALDCAPALGFMDRFVHDGGKKYPHTIDLKTHGVRPFVDGARIWGLKHQAWATNTGDRLRAVAGPLQRSPSATAALIEAFELIQRLRLRQQLSATEAEMANRIDPRQLPTLQKLLLKEALKQAKLLQLALKQEFAL
jgi:CBS domain-containing protein